MAVSGNIGRLPTDGMADTPEPATELIGVLDMGASAIRLVVAEIDAKRQRPASSRRRRAACCSAATRSRAASIRSQTVDAALEALDGFRDIMDGYGVGRRPRGGDERGARGAQRRHVPRPHPAAAPASRSRSSTRPKRAGSSTWRCGDALRRHAAFKAARTLLVEVGGGSTSLTLLRRGQPTRSGVYALGAVRLRQQLDLRRHTHELQVALLKRYIANVIEEIRARDPARPHHARDRDRRRRPVRRVAARRDGEPDGDVREIPRDAFLAFCDEVERLDEDGLVDRFRLPAVEAETLVPALLVYRALLSETAGAQRWSCPTRRCGPACCSTSPSRRPPDAPRTSSIRCWPAPTRSATATASIATTATTSRMLATRLFDELRDEHGLGDRERLLLQVAGLLHDVGIYVSLRAHHKHSQYILAASQIFGLSERGDRDRLEHRALSPPRPAAGQPPAVHRARPHRSADRQQAGGDPPRGQRARRRARAEGAGRRGWSRRGSDLDRWSSRATATSRWSSWRRRRAPTCSPRCSAASSSSAWQESSS